jgi:signal transduction histidine kinase
MGQKKWSFYSVFYLLVLGLCTITIFQLIAGMGNTGNTYQTTFDTAARAHRTLLNIQHLVSEMQTEKAAILFNNAPDDIAASLENIHKHEAAVNHESKIFEEQLPYPDLKTYFDTLATLNKQNAALTNDLATLENASAIDLYYTRQLPLFEKIKTHLLEMDEAIAEKSRLTIANTNTQADKKDRSTLMWLSICLLTIVSGLVFTITQENKRMAQEKTLTQLRSEEHLENLKRGLRGQEQDRQLLGTELHDNINQQLAIIKLNLSLVQNDPANNTEMIELASRRINDVMEEIRMLTRTLVNPVARNISLRDSIADLVQSFKDVLYTTEFNLYLEENDEEKFLSPEVKVNIFRIVQEQVSNIVKHANATIVNICLTYDAGEIRLTIEDNGIGFDAKKPYQGIGLTSIRQRAKAFAGDLEIESSPGKGCVLSVTFPY